MPRIRILIADDHPPFREGFSRLLSEEPDMEVIAKAADGAEAVRLAKTLSPDVAIIDVAMPQLNGIEAARQITADCPGTNVLMISAYDSEPYLAASLQAGATGYLLKSCSLAELISAVRSTSNGQGVFDLKSINAVLGRAVSKKPTERGSTEWLQPRELEVLKLAAKGMSNKDISRELYISDRTVQSHLVSVFRKLGVSSRTQAILRALKKGWISLDDLADEVSL